MLIDRANAGPYILGLLAVFAMVGVFSLFALALRPIAVSGRETGPPVLKAVADEAIDGLLVIDLHGRVIYTNAAYRTLIDASDAKDVRSIDQVFIGDPDVSEVRVPHAEGRARRPPCAGRGARRRI